MSWHGSKACKKRKLQSMSWLRNLKNKKYPIWRFDTFFSKTKYSNLEIINDGGWHFTNLKSPEDLFKKMKNAGHHNEFDDSKVTLDFIREKINKHEVFYNHFLDKTDKKNRFVAIQVKFKEKFKKPVTLEIIKKIKEIHHLPLIKQTRLSVMPVDYKSWKIIYKIGKV